jgi:hypothetical protein
MTIFSNCDVHSENPVHLTMHSTNTNINLNLIAESQNGTVLSYLTRTFEFVKPNNLFSIRTIKDFVDLANKAINVNGLQHREVETFFIFKIEINIFTCIVIVVINVIIVKILKCTTRKLRKNILLKRTIKIFKWCVILST